MSVRPSSAEPPILQLDHVSRSYGAGDTEVAALCEVDLRVSAGEMVAVVGDSGSGKSTLLALCGGLDEPTSGRVLVEGHELGGMSYDDLARLRRRHVGYVFQDFNLLPGLSAIENVSLPLELDGVGLGRSRAAARAALERVEIADLASRFPAQMSGGQQQRVSIARALVGQRRLVLADEPTGALDDRTGRVVLDLLRGACREGAACVLVTHNEAYARFADRVVRLVDGRPVGDVTSAGGH